MNKNEKLIESLTGFFITMGKRDGHRSDHILSLLREIHFTALYHAICENATTVHSFAALSDTPGKLNYRSNPLFPGNATLIWTEETYHVHDDLLSATRYLELWVKDDMTLPWYPASARYSMMKNTLPSTGRLRRTAGL